MDVAVIPPQFAMEPTMPTIVAVTKPIVEAIMPALETIMYPIVSSFETIMVVTAPSAMLWVEAECAHGQQ